MNFMDLLRPALEIVSPVVVTKKLEFACRTRGSVLASGFCHLQEQAWDGKLQTLSLNTSNGAPDLSLPLPLGGAWRSRSSCPPALGGDSGVSDVPAAGGHKNQVVEHKQRPFAPARAAMRRFPFGSHFGELQVLPKSGAQSHDLSNFGSLLASERQQPWSHYPVTGPERWQPVCNFCQSIISVGW